MDSDYHYTLDLNEYQFNNSFFTPLGSSLHHDHHQQHPHASFNISSSSSLNSPSLSYLPFLINSHQDQLNVGYNNNNNNTFHGFLDLSQSLETNKFVSNGGSSSSSDQMVPKKETRLKLTIRKKDNHQDKIVRMIKKKKKKTMVTTTNNIKQHVSDMVRICSDCNTTKTPLWRSGPRGPKSLCNACGIRQRKARQAAAAAITTSNVSPPVPKKKKVQNKNKRSYGPYNFSCPKVKICKNMDTPEKDATIARDSNSQSKSTISSYSSDKLYCDDLAMILSKSLAYQQVFPQDEKDAAILLMALSYGMVHG
ncbi:unnamed protein product [Cochlearia groenlandica]